MSQLYGKHEVPFSWDSENLSLSVEKDGSVKYKRITGSETVEKDIEMKKNSILIHPIEPLNLPKELTSSLMIELNKPVVVDSGAKKRLYATFPLEIAVFIDTQQNKKPLDIFSLTKQKYTLYGDVNDGTICKYWSSDPQDEPPEDLNYLEEGILELAIENRSKEWQEVHKVVLSAYDMSIFFDDEKVAMSAKMTIREGETSETSVNDKAPFEGMKKASEIYRRKKMPLKGKSMKFMMESGI